MLPQKLECPPLNPKSLGSWVEASTQATPVLNPIRTVSEMKLTITPARISQAASAIAATSRAVHAANAPKRDTSPLASSPREVPISREMAEVTVIEVCRELQNSQKTKPEKRHA